MAWQGYAFEVGPVKLLMYPHQQTTGQPTWPLPHPDVEYAKLAAQCCYKGTHNELEHLINCAHPLAIRACSNWYLVHNDAWTTSVLIYLILTHIAFYFALTWRYKTRCTLTRKPTHNWEKCSFSCNYSHNTTRLLSALFLTVIVLLHQVFKNSLVKRKH